VTGSRLGYENLQKASHFHKIFRYRLSCYPGRYYSKPTDWLSVLQIPLGLDNVLSLAVTTMMVLGAGVKRSFLHAKVLLISLSYIYFHEEIIKKKKKTMSNTDQKVSHAEAGCFSSIAPEEEVDNRPLYFHLQIDHQLVR
jgi:hypothetical protein